MPDSQHLTLDETLKESSQPYQNCSLAGFVGVPQQETRGVCNRADLLTPDRRLYWHLEFHDEVVSVSKINVDALALELVKPRWDPLDLGLPPKLLRISVYDLATRTEKCSVDLRKLRPDENHDFAVSPDGLLAVRIGSQLTVYKF